MSTEKSAQGGKVIDGNVAAAASAAGVGINEASKYTLREVVHHRLAFNPSNGEEVGRETMIEYEVTGGTPPEGFKQFTGLGTLEANITVQQGQPPKKHVEQYRFPVEGKDLEEAWALYADSASRGAENAKAEFRRRYAEYEKAMREQILVPGAPGGGLLGPNGAPIQPRG